MKLNLFDFTIREEYVLTQYKSKANFKMCSWLKTTNYFDNIIYKNIWLKVQSPTVRLGTGDSGSTSIYIIP